ncbi:glucosamine-6-phosphate deaminase [Paenibacillus aceris]|uniref:Glucosamine-6-phosphate deaminase n=1 Tax=Paenibacillus aceris TaxID=869555 RepID=A0ABS4I1I6_9BACL|nr:glucosamine-6-phosphate deaminase [Paenibacillus aceris]MBP1964281.1 glucosamine-6-phosphate deaminase [Paenibacillus aceris]NHW36602.1 glucosamine-6-phosphate deaminase [Paenibacillus aceris]
MKQQAHPILVKQVDDLEVQVFADRLSLGEAAASQAAAVMKELLAGSQDDLVMVFAAAPSQNEFLAALIQEEGIDWQRITAFHMDEYIGLPAGAPQSFGSFLTERLFSKVPFAAVHRIDSTNDIEKECARYEAQLLVKPIDIVCLGIGENGHIAFNDPPVADFNDKVWVKPVELDEDCRKQQVNDGCFAELKDVPTHALTLTIPALISGKHLFCMVPGPTKREAVHRTLSEPVSTACPATILRFHPSIKLYVDADSFGGIPDERGVEHGVG